MNKPNVSLTFLKFLGPGILVTVGFIDPGNWASNIAAGSFFGYKLLWMVTLSTIMLIILQHNVAHLGIVTGKCLAENTATHLSSWFSITILLSAVIASIATALAEVLGAGIALKMLFGIPVQFAVVIILFTVLFMLFIYSYKRLEKIIIAFVSLISFAFLVEIYLIHVDWKAVAISSVTPAFPAYSIAIIMSVLGAVVMPHNLFLHSEIIQSKNLNTQGPVVIEKRLKYEFLDTLFSMGLGWAINSAIIILAAATFYYKGIKVDDIEQTVDILKPLLGGAAAIVFALAFFFSGFASSITAGMAGGSIFAGLFNKSYNQNNLHTRVGIIITLLGAVIIIFFISDPFKGLIYSQTLLSIQLPITIFLQIYLTSSKKIMGKYKNSLFTNILLWGSGLIVSGLNILLLLSFMNIINF
ncbi:Nramp family divalent metal transporter [Rickettsiales bacterium LUAb2]